MEIIVVVAAGYRRVDGTNRSRFSAYFVREVKAKGFKSPRHTNFLSYDLRIIPSTPQPHNRAPTSVTAISTQ